MSQGSPQPTTPAPGRSAPGGWRGGAVREVPRHRWQRDGMLAGERLVGSRAVRGIRLVIWFGAAAVLLALLLWYLLYAPVQTPVLAVAATQYDWPLPPNAWAAEDVAGLNDLHDKTLHLADLSADWRSTSQGLARLDSELASLARRHGRARVAVIYLSMHGTIDGDGQPCLIPPDATPHDSRTWLRLETVFERLRAARLPADMHKLVVLDCSRDLANWNVGQLYNGVADVLESAVAHAQIPNLAVLHASSPGQSAVATPALRKSLLGHYLQLGLAGAADSRQFGGNGNGRVSLQELKRYLQRHVDGWAMHHEGRSQRPMVVPADADFDVAWTLRWSAWRNLVDRAGRVERATPPVSDRAVLELWTKLDGLRDARPWRFDPVGWRELEHRLLWLEQLAAAGSAYESRSLELMGELNGRLADAERRHAEARRAGSLPAYAAILSGDAANSAPRVHSLPMAQFWGTIDPDALRSLREQLASCQQDPSAVQIATALAKVEAAELPVALDEANCLAIWQRLAVPGLWSDADPLRQALLVRRLAEEHAAPAGLMGIAGDERAHAWLRPQLEPLDHQRRAMEDAVLLGPGRNNGHLPQGSQTLQALQSLELYQRAGEVLALRDELWAELPYLAEWLCRPQTNAAEQDAADAVIRQTLLPLIDDALKLERELRRDGPTAGQRGWTADATAESVRRRLADLRGHFQSAIDDVKGAIDGADAVRECDAVLAVPRLDWATRQRLRQKRLELHLKLSSGYDPLHAGPPAAAEQRVSAAQPLDRMTLRWPEHPLVQMLERVPLAATADEAAPPASTEPAASLLAVAQAGEQVRARLRRLSGADQPARLGSAAASAAATDRTATALPPGPLSDAASQLRAAAALWFPAPANDAVAALRRSDLQQWMLWRATRALDDFQGPARPGGEPLFAVAAADYLAAARALGPMSLAAEQQAAEIADLLTKRRVAARDALAVSATDVLLVEQATSVTSLLDVRARLPEAVSHLPPGTAAVFLADPAGRVGSESSPLPLPRDAARAEETLLSTVSTLQTESLRNRSPILQAVATLRGNDYTAPVLLRAPGGVQVEVDRPPLGPPQISVAGYEQKRASLVFILDCSYSMRDPTSAEGPDGTSQPTTPRMEAAKGALRALLTDLAERGGTRVGVRFFGHRAGWSTVESDKLLRQTGYAGEIPAELRPYADVENVLPLGRFDSIAAGLVFDKLRTVRPWGETPLYLALREAVADFGAEDDAARSIVVITDGQNNQFNPPPQFNASLSEVISAAEQARVAIHLVGFEIPRGEAQAAGRDFQEIARRTGGSFVSAAGATQLSTTLQALLRPGEFRVTSPDGAILAQAELGRRVTLPEHRGRRSYGVSFEGLREPVELAGGELVELAVRRGSGWLEVVPNVPMTLRGEPLRTHDEGETRLVAWAHRPVRIEQGVKFPLSIQHQQSRFVPRPVEYWVEIEPDGLPPEADAATYVFYDSVWRPGTSVPFAELTSAGWPTGAARARLSVWCKTTATIPTAERPLAQVADRLPEDGPGFTIAGVPGVTYQVRTVSGGGRALAVGLVERHDERSPGVGSLKVALSPPPDAIRHQFDPKNRLVLHVFTYDQPDENLRDRVTIQFTTRQAAQQQAARTVLPIVVDVSDRSDLLELTPVAER